MLYKYFVFFALSVTMSFILGCEIQQASYEDTGIGGTIIDSSTKIGLPGVLVTLNPDNYTATTDSNGFFYIGKIGVPSSAGNFTVTMTKAGYKTLNFLAVLHSGDTTKRYNLAMYNPTLNSVFIANDLVVSEYITKRSLSILDLFELNVVNDSFWYKIDAILLDSAGTRSNFTFHCGGYAQPVSGWDTRFTPLLGYYSQYDFDTLSRIDVGPRDINPDIDFPTQITQSFNAPLSQSPVFGFYLIGRYWYGARPRTYGLLRIDNFYFDNNEGIYKAVVDVKINRNEQNYFLLK